MNIKREIVDRALEAAGQERLNDEDIEKDSARWRLIKDNYLSVILTTLAKTAWTSRLTRKPLSKSENENYTSYTYMYDLPTDCAKPEELQDNAEFNVEGNYLYTDQDDAVLLYVSNGKREADEIPDEDDDDYEEEDYPLYDDIDFDPNLSEYIELQLAAKIALKITGDMNTFGILYNQAIVVENNAKKATLEHAHSKEKGAAWWGDQMGLTVEAK